MKTFKTTIKNLSQEIGCDYQTTSALMKILVKVGAAKENGKEALPAGTRGKPAQIFEVDNEFEMVFREEENQLEEKTDEIPVSV